MSCPSYSYEIGSSFDDEISEFSGAVREELESQLWSLFSDPSVWTSSTDYDWTQVSSEARENDDAKHRVVAEEESLIPPGKIKIDFFSHLLLSGSWKKVEQVVGRCGGNVVRTEMLRTSYDLAEADTRNGKTFYNILKSNVKKIFQGSQCSIF